MTQPKSPPPDRSSRRAFLRRALTAGAVAGTAPSYARASGAAVAWRDRWLYWRLSARQPVRRDEVVERPGQDAIVLERPDIGGEWTLNHTAEAVWSLCDGRRPVSGIAREIAAAYGVPVARVQGDVAAVVRDLVRAGCLSA